MPSLMIKGRSWRFEHIGNKVKFVSPKKKVITFDTTSFQLPDGRLNVNGIRRHVEKNFA